MFSKKGLFFLYSLLIYSKHINFTIFNKFEFYYNYWNINGYKNISTPLLKTFERIDNLRNDMTE